jgi:hypothetical protein
MGIMQLKPFPNHPFCPPQPLYNVPSLKVSYARSKEGLKGAPVGEKTAKHFMRDATVNPTQSDAFATKNMDVVNYFAHFCEKEPEPTILNVNRFIACKDIAAVGSWQVSFDQFK